jgi:hypothetical protein
MTRKRQSAFRQGRKGNLHVKMARRVSSPWFLEDAFQAWTTTNSAEIGGRGSYKGECTNEFEFEEDIEDEVALMVCSAWGNSYTEGGQPIMVVNI